MTAHRHKNGAGKFVTALDGAHVHPLPAHTHPLDPAVEARIKELERMVVILAQPVLVPVAVPVPAPALLLTEMLADSPTMLLRGHEPSGSTANDSSTGGIHDGALQANVAFGGAALVAADTSMDFSGTAPSYVDVADHANFDRTDSAMSLVFVVQRDTIASATVFDKGTTGGTSWRCHFTASGTYLAWGENGSDRVYAPISADTDPHLYVITWSGAGGVGHIYEDGEDITQSTDTLTTIANSSNALRLGDSHAGSSRIDGRIAYAAYYPTVLSPTRVLAYQVAWTGTGPPVDPPVGYVGYGSQVTGGTGQTDVHVTNTNASGAGSLAAAMGSNRNIVFDVSGTIDLTSVGDEIGGSGYSNFTIDGSTAPGAGITITKWGLEFSGCSNFILKHLAVRDVDANQFQSAITLRNTCTDFILDHLSVDGYSHRGIDIYNGCHDGTVSWCFVGKFGPTGLSNFPMLVGKIVDRVSVDHCVFFDGDTRMPQFDYDNTDGAGPVPTGITGDMANCLVYEWDYSGLTLHGNAWVNVRQTYFKSSTNTTHNLAIHTETGATVYQSGCTGSGVAITTANNAGTPYDVAAYAVLPLESTATVAATASLAEAGRLPRDATDTAYAAAMTIT